uniref:Uncharacterized protein n=1 Tax=Manihot esculenta TaxID=3983 RepID=A0A2C9W7F4_MANES
MKSLHSSSPSYFIYFFPPSFFSLVSFLFFPSILLLLVSSLHPSSPYFFPPFFFSLVSSLFLLSLPYISLASPSSQSSPVSSFLSIS